MKRIATGNFSYGHEVNLLLKKLGLQDKPIKVKRRAIIKYMQEVSKKRNSKDKPES